MRAVCVFCGSSTGAQTEYADCAREVGRLLAEQDLAVVYGGAKVGLMGLVADAALAAGGRVIGVIPKALTAKEIVHGGLTELHVVGSMHERKALMAERADAFLALPGGMGTLEEIFEALTWAQLGLHASPCGFLNTGGYYDAIETFLDQAVTEGFIKKIYRELTLFDRDPVALLERFASYRAPEIPVWIRSDET